MDALWTLPELVAEVAARIAALPAPRNGQVRAIPDDRTVRYYVTLGLLDRPSAMRGRTALYGRKHAAQVVAIKRLQTMGRSLSEIQQLWPTLDDRTLARMSGVDLPAGKPAARPAARGDFWKREPRTAGGDAGEGSPAGPVSPEERSVSAERSASAPGAGPLPRSMRAAPPPGAPPPWAPGTALPQGAAGAVELRIELAPQVVLSLSIANDGHGPDDRVVISPADVGAIRAAAAPLLAELASRWLAPHPGGHPGGEEP